MKQFKEHIASAVEIPVDKQRLIYQGKVLQDERTLTEYSESLLSTGTVNCLYMTLHVCFWCIPDRRWWQGTVFLSESLEPSLNRFVQNTDSFRNWTSNCCWIRSIILLLLFLTIFFYGRNSKRFMWLIKNVYISRWLIKKCWLIQELKFVNIFICKGKTKYGCTINSILIGLAYVFCFFRLIKHNHWLFVLIFVLFYISVILHWFKV